MTITRIDTQLTTDTAGVASRVVTKPTVASLQPGDVTWMVTAGNLNPSPTITAQPPGFTQIGSRITAGGGPSLHVDAFYRVWDAAGIASLPTEDWTLTYSGTDKCQTPVITYRGILTSLPFLNRNTWVEGDTVGARHYEIGSLSPSATLCVPLLFMFDRLTSPPSYTQVGSSDTVVLNDPGSGTNAVTCYVLEGPVLNPFQRYQRNLNLSTPSAIAAAVMWTMVDIGSNTANFTRPMGKTKRWSGSAWDTQSDLKFWAGSAWSPVTSKRFT